MTSSEDQKSTEDLFAQLRAGLEAAEELGTPVLQAALALGDEHSELASALMRNYGRMMTALGYDVSKMKIGLTPEAEARYAARLAAMTPEERAAHAREISEE